MAVLFGGIHSGGIVQTPAGTWVDGQKIDRDFAPGETRKTIRTANGTVVEMTRTPGGGISVSTHGPRGSSAVSGVWAEEETATAGAATGTRSPSPATTGRCTETQTA